MVERRQVDCEGEQGMRLLLEKCRHDEPLVAERGAF